MRKAAILILMFCLSCAVGVRAFAASPALTPQQDNGQQGYPQDPNQQNYSQDPNQQYQDNGQDNGDYGGYENYSPDQLDNLLAPIALYPDPLLAQVLPASTFVDQIDEASRYVRSYGDNGVDSQNWDVSVKAVAHYPSVLNMMADKIDWTTALGQAYVNQSTDVMLSVQRLRRLANDQGNLQTNQQQQVIVDPGYIQIWPAQPQYVYVPVYNPAYVYYQRPPRGQFFVSFGSGFSIGVWLNRDFDWGGRRVYYTGWNGGGWVGRSRGYVHVNNTVYVNNRYTNITINRTVVNRRVNYNSINRYNSVHRKVNYDNLKRNNVIRDKRPVNTRPGNSNRPGNNNRPGNPGNNNRPGNPGTRPGDNNRPANPGERPGGNNRPGAPVTTQPVTQPVTRPSNRGPNNGVIDRNIDRNSPSLDKYRGRDNPAAQPQPARPAPSRSAGGQPRAFNTRQTDFNANQASARGAQSRAQVAPKQQARPAPAPRQAPAQRQPAAQRQAAPQRSNAKQSGRPK